MEIVDQLLAIFIYLVLLALALIPLERAFLAHEQSIFRREWGTDLLFFLGGNLLWTKITLLVLGTTREWLQTLELSKIKMLVQSLPVVMQWILLIFLSDVSIYWAHRLSHKYDFLWRFHKVHHTTEQLDWLAAFREHPLDNIYTRVIVNVPFMVLGFPLESIAAYVIFRGIWGNFIHSNTPFGLGPFKYMLGSPRLHHWHHDFERNSKCNFANLMPLMDVLFGTFYDPGHMPRRYGIDDPIAHNYVAQLLYPLLPESLVQLINKKPRL